MAAAGLAVSLRLTLVPEEFGEVFQEGPDHLALLASDAEECLQLLSATRSSWQWLHFGVKVQLRWHNVGKHTVCEQGEPGQLALLASEGNERLYSSL